MFTDLAKSDTASGTEKVQSEPKNRLARHVMTCFQRNSDFRRSSGAEKVITDAIMAYNLIANPAERAMFDRMGVSPETYDPIVRSKVNNIIALLTRIFVNQGRTWFVEASPLPEVPQSVITAIYGQIFQEFITVLQAVGMPLTPEQVADYAFKRADDILTAQKAWADERAARMDTLVDDILTEGAFDEVLREAIIQMVKTGTGVVIGPFEVLEYGVSAKTGKSIGDVSFERKLKRKMKYFTPDTLDCFPSPGAKRDTDGDLVIRVRYALSDLALYAEQAEGYKSKEKRGPDGWDAAAVSRVVSKCLTSDRFPTVPLPIDSLIEEVSFDSASANVKQVVEGVRYFGSRPGDMLIENGVKKDADGKPLNKFSWYEADIQVIDGEIVCAKVCDSAIGRPVQKMVCYADPSSWFGGTFAMMLRNVQAIRNIVIASLKKQIQLAAGPMIVYNDFENFIGAENPQTFSIAPYRQLFRKVNPLAQSANAKPIDTIEFQTRIAEFLKVLEALDQMADDLTMFPRLMFGSNGLSGALRTARGMAMAQEAANIGASWIVGNIDSQIVKPAIRKLVTWINMRYPDPNVKGDVTIVARGALGQVLETARRDEAQNLYAMVSRDAMLVQQLGPTILVRLFRHVLETMGVKDPDQYVPSKERLEEMETISRIARLQQAMPPPDAQGGAPGPQGGFPPGDGAMNFQTGQQGPQGATPTGLPPMTGTQVAGGAPGEELLDTSDVRRRRSVA